MNNKKIYKIFNPLLKFFEDIRIEYVDQYNKNISNYNYMNNLNYEMLVNPKCSFDQNVGKNDILVNRYPNLEEFEDYIFIANRYSDIDSMIITSVIDRHTYIIEDRDNNIHQDRYKLYDYINGIIYKDEIDNSFFDKIKGSSILTFIDKNCNYSPNKFINNPDSFFIDLASKLGRKIVVVSMVKENCLNRTYIDFSQPIDINDIKGNKINYVIDMMSTMIYYFISKYFEVEKRGNQDIVEYNHRCFYNELTDKNNDNRYSDSSYYDIERRNLFNSIYNLRFNKKILRNGILNTREEVREKINIDKENFLEYVKKRRKIL